MRDDSSQQYIKLINSGKSLPTILDYIHETSPHLLNEKKTYRILADLFAKRGQLENAKLCYKKIIELWPDSTAGAHKLLQNLAHGNTTIGDTLLTLRHPAISAFMQIKLATGHYEALELTLLEQHLEENDSVMELGCGVGLLGISAVKIVPSINYYAYEANPHLIDLIKTNQALNNVSFPVANKILDKGNGEKSFYIVDDFWASSLIEPKHYKEKKSIPVSDINAEVADKSINFLIVDIEGGEQELIAKIDFSSINKLLIEMHPRIIGEERVAELVTTIEASGLKRSDDLPENDVMFFQRQSPTNSH